jgi:membrane protein YdbS with pleckstrin-like domain
MTPFTNEVIQIDSLPKYEEVEMIPVQQKYWTVMIIHFWIAFLVMGGIVTGLSFIPEWRPNQMFIISGYLIFMIIWFFLQRISFLKRSYVVREKDIIYRHGILATITTIIPFTRIQHVGINEGFVSRIYKLAQLQIYTAGGSSGDLKIPGLRKEDAEKIKEVIMLHITKKKIENEVADQ